MPSESEFFAELRRELNAAPPVDAPQPAATYPGLDLNSLRGSLQPSTIKALEDVGAVEEDPLSPENLQKRIENFETGAFKQTQGMTFPESNFTFPGKRGDKPTKILTRDHDLFRKTYDRFLGVDVDDPLGWERMFSVMAFGGAGAKAGLSLGAPAGPGGMAVGTVVGGLAGAAAGAAAPETTLDLMEEFGWLPDGAREERALTDEELRAVVEGEALVELATAGFFGAARLGSRAAGRAMTGITKESEKIAEMAAREGVEIPAVVAGESTFGSGLVNVLGRFPFWGSKARSRINKAQEGVVSFSKDIPDRIAPIVSSSDLSLKIYNEARNLWDSTSKAFSARYEKLFADALEADVKITPDFTKTAANQINKEIAEKTPNIKAKKLEGLTAFVEKDVAGTGSAASEYVKGVLNSPEFSRLSDEQTLGQMDELLSKVGQAIDQAPQEIRRSVSKRLSALTAALKQDVQLGLEQYPEISESLRQIDADFSEAQRTIFETSIAKRFGNVRKGGLKSTVAPSEEATRNTVDSLAKFVVDLDSPQAIDELSRLVSPSTMKQVSSRVLSDAFDKAIKKDKSGKWEFNGKKFQKHLGLTGKPNERGQAIERLFQGTNWNQESLTTLSDLINKFGAASMPDVSTFVQRRAILGGVGAIARSFVPFIATAGTGFLGSMFYGLTMLVGPRTLMRMVSDPDNARALSKVIDKEATKAQVRTNAVQLLRASIEYNNEDIMVAANDAKDFMDQNLTAEQAAAGYSTAKNAVEQAPEQIMQFGQELFDGIGRHFSNNKE